MQAFAYFPSIIYREEYPELVDQTLQASDKYYVFAKQNIQNADKFDVIQTSSMSEDQDLSILKNCFYETSINILREQGYLIDMYDFYVSQMWGHEVKNFGFNETHVHANSQICGFYFFKTSENGVYPVFKDPRNAKSMVDLLSEQTKDVRLSTTTINFQNVLPGTFLFCNAWLPHQIMCAGSKEPSRFIHFILSHKEKIQ